MKLMIDPFGRSITYLRISLTDRCNLRCAYCMPDGTAGGMPRSNFLTDNEIIRVVEAGANLGADKIRLTGGEPLVRPRVVELVRRIAAIPGIHDISLTTNAILLEKFAQLLRDAGLRRVNISLDTLDKKRFKQVTRFGDFDKTWRGILAAERAGLTPLKLNAVVVNGFNADELHTLARLTLEHPWHVRFIELMPVGSGKQDWGAKFPHVDDRYLSVQKMRSRLGMFDLQPETNLPGNGPASTFRIPGAPGTIGFISPLGEHFCQNCNRLRLTADGHLRACLLNMGEVSLRDALRTGADLEPLFKQAVQLKSRGHMLSADANPISPNASMSQIGG
jgi:GTP 3',8-cyclase